MKADTPSNPIRPARVLKRTDPPAGKTPPSPGAVWVEEQDGSNGHWIGAVIQDRTDGITAADLNFNKRGK